MLLSDQQRIPWGKSLAGDAAMSEYRMYCLHKDNRIAHALNIFSADDAAAIEDAIRIDHHAVVEIWSGKRLVGRVDPGTVTALVLDPHHQGASRPAPILAATGTRLRLG